MGSVGNQLPNPLIILKHSHLTRADMRIVNTMFIDAELHLRERHTNVQQIFLNLGLLRALGWQPSVAHPIIPTNRSNR